MNDNGTLISGGMVHCGGMVAKQDILIQAEKISAIGQLDNLPGRGIRKIDARGMLVLPGAIDPHVHFNDAFMNTVSVHDFYTGTRAAAFGGVTSIIDFANQEKGESLSSTLRRKKEEAVGQALVDWGVHPVITDFTAATTGQISKMVQAGAPTIKCYMTYESEGLMMDLERLKTILRALNKAGGMLLVHAEDNDSIEKRIKEYVLSNRLAPRYHARSRPEQSENKAIKSCIQMVEEVGGRLFIVHMTSAAGLGMVAAARAKGLNVFAETCTHYLIFSRSQLSKKDGIKWICSPPLRDNRTRQKLWLGLRSGIISQVSSDDAAYSWQAKAMGKTGFHRCPNGIPGVEVRLPLLYSEGVVKGRISLNQMVELTATAPARLFGLFPKKGILAPGADADIILFDPKKNWVMEKNSLHMAADWSAYEGIKIRGKISKVFSRGELIIDGNRCLATRGRGRYLFRKPIVE